MQLGKCFGQSGNCCIAGLLADAVLYLSAIEGDDSRSGPVTNSAGDTLNMYFYDYAFLEQALRDAGFDVEYAERKEYTDGKGVLVADWMVVGRVGLKPN